MPKNAIEEVKAIPADNQPSAIGHYTGRLKSQQGEIEFELRQPTLDDMPLLEELLASRGFDLASMSDMPKTEQVYMLFILLCVRFGDQTSCSREQLGKLPMAAFMEVSKAVENFREQFGV